ncbi:MAG: cyclic nucleotide-binding domain-containing protein [Planctomycetota bacterium]
MTGEEPREPPVARLEGDALSVEDMLALPIFDAKMKPRLEKNVGAVVRRRFRPGDIVCREGEYGSTAFYLLEGEAEVYIAAPLAHLRGSPRRGGIFRRVQAFFQSLAESEDAESRAKRFIPIDASVDLAQADPVATLRAGDLFGEMTCLSFYPRSATVRARSEVVALEMLRNILDILKKGPFQQQLEKNYRERALASHLRSLPPFRDLTDEFIDGLRERVELVAVEPGTVICRQGDPADKLYLVRVGFVKVTQSSPGGEVVLQYLHRGDYFGEIGLLGGGVRTATCTALDHVELVQIGKEDFDRMMREFPAMRAGMEEKARGHLEGNAKRMQQLSGQSVDEFLEQGLLGAQSLLLIDLDRCTRCDDCVRACAASHDGVTRLIRDGLRYGKYLVPTSCRSCMDPLCMIGCPVGSIRRKETLEIVIEDWCIGCGLCAKNCPYGNINMHTIGTTEEGEEAKKAKPKQKAITCDLCADIGTPSCVYACPHEAALRVDPREFFLERRP